jgi:orotidine-5'-phosphate decarboxylase
VCLGIDPNPATLSPEEAPGADLTDIADRAAAAIHEHSVWLIEKAGPACVAVKPQLACFERLGAPGWRALSEV